MKGLLKNLGLILILIGVVILLACSFTGNVNNNAVLVNSLFTSHSISKCNDWSNRISQTKRKEENKLLNFIK